MKGSRWAKNRVSEGPQALTADLSCGVLGDHGVGGELGMQDAAVCVGVHGQCIQQLAVLQHPCVLWAASLGHQGHHVLCKAQPAAGPEVWALTRLPMP